ncbi:MAG: iron ABC transporter permease, partial [Alphaproteobacteria bacterium]|nr:iron ABC transporter permease [Alphaproteobacteria bacterium]
MTALSFDRRAGRSSPRPWAIDRWRIGALLGGLVVGGPILAVLGLAATAGAGVWPHLWANVLPNLARTSALLLLAVGLGTFVIGVATAWLTTICEFPGRRILAWALLAPLAVPAYVNAYVYTAVLDYPGPVQAALRTTFGWASARDYWFPEVRSLGGAAFMLTLVLYPYVYLLCRAAFLEQSVCALEVSRTLGCGPWRSFFAIALPLARPAVAAGLILVGLETLNDYGTVDYFAVNTFTRGIFTVWFGMNSVAGAAQIAVLLLAIAVLLITLERWQRARLRFHHTSARYRPLTRHRLRGARAAAAVVACASPVALGFLFPAGVLVALSAPYLFTTSPSGIGRAAVTSLALSGAAAALALVMALFLGYAVRQRPRDTLVRGASRLASFGYALPGAVLAVGVLVPLGWFDNALDGWLRTNAGISTGLLLSGTFVALVFGYVVRFQAVSAGAVEAGLSKITPSMDQAARV